MDADGKETASYTRCDGELISMERSGEVWYYLYDELGSTRLLTNEAGRITDKYAYDAYGSLLKKSGGTENDFLYTGEQYNANTGLYYLRARYMDPGTGTFISMDSYQGSLYDPVSLHKYLYANANPVTYTDPSGYMAAYAIGMGEYSINAAAEAQRNSVILNIGLKLISSLRAINAVKAVAYVSAEVILTLVIDDVLNPGDFTDFNNITIKILTYISENLEFICDKAGIASETIAEGIRDAIYEAKGKENKKNGSESDDKSDNKTDTTQDDKTADEIISENKKGGIRQKFPKEWLNKTMQEIEKAAKAGNRTARTAKKLLNDKDFDKGSNSMRSKKGK